MPFRLRLLAPAARPQTHPAKNFWFLALGSIGVVFGDIGTSPLYALQTALGQFSGLGAPQVVGVVSLIIWALLIVVTAKYVLFLMQADNKGEGGILSLMALARALGQRTTLVFLLGVAGCALFSGDAIITPAISVLSALEGLEAGRRRASRLRAADDRRDSDRCCSSRRAAARRAWRRSSARSCWCSSRVIAVLGLMHIPHAWVILQRAQPASGTGLPVRRTARSASSCSAACSWP